MSNAEFNELEKNLDLRYHKDDEKRILKKQKLTIIIEYEEFITDGKTRLDKFIEHYLGSNAVFRILVEKIESLDERIVEGSTNLE